MWASSELKYEGCSINKLQNGVRFVGNLFLYLHRNFYNSDIIMTSLVLEAQSPCKIFSSHHHNIISRGVVVNFDLQERFPRPRSQQLGSLMPNPAFGGNLGHKIN